VTDTATAGPELPASSPNFSTTFTPATYVRGDRPAANPGLTPQIYINPAAVAYFTVLNPQLAGGANTAVTLTNGNCIWVVEVVSPG